MRRRTIILLSHLLQQGNEGFVELRGNCGFLGWIGVQQMTSRESLVRRQCEICHNCSPRVRLQLWKQLEHKLQERKRVMSSVTQSNFIYTFYRFLTFSSEVEERQHGIQTLKNAIETYWLSTRCYEINNIFPKSISVFIQKFINLK